MSFKPLFAAAAIFLAAPALAGGIRVEDPYARASAMKSTSGAAFMIIHNDTGEDDHLVGARADIAERVELHTHREDANGVMHMLHVEEGFDLPAGGTLEMRRGGNHVMFLGLKRPMEQGAHFPLTLIFEKAGDVTVDVPVDLKRKPMHGAMKHGNMQHGNMQMDATASD